MPLLTLLDMSKSQLPAIRFDHVTKVYRLGAGPKDQLLEALGLSRFAERKQTITEFRALDDVSFTLGRGRRMGIIGRNGAGKTTLLRLISSNFRPTTGTMEVNGSIQALMTMGQGFHPDYTGRENIQASLQYNGLSNADTQAAFDDVVDFCELGAFLDQPFKTYSSGMQSRLMFATATAIRPDILIVDEVLGAGDAYFLAKSKQRVDQIIKSGCTLLLVSHAMGQILELCDEAIWLEGGRIAKVGSALEVVKAYEEAVYGAMPGSGDPSATRRKVMADGGLKESTAALRATEPSPPFADGLTDPASALLAPQYRQIPYFTPHMQQVSLPVVPAEMARKLSFAAPGGISRWESEGGLKIVGFNVSGPRGQTDRITSLQPAKFTVFLEVEEAGEFDCTYGLAIHDLQGRAMSRLFAPPDRFDAKPGDGRRIEMILNPNQLGPGIYTVGISILGKTTIEAAGHAKRYDLLSRSFTITVELPDSYANASAEFFHTSEWHFSAVELPAPDNSPSSDEQA